MSILRSKELHKKYMEYIAQGGLSKGCVLCVREPLVEFKIWKIIPNDFPTIGSPACTIWLCPNAT